MSQLIQYFYAKSSKKHRKLKNLHDMLKGELEMYTFRVRTMKVTSTRWIGHKLWAMDHLIEKFGLYSVHLNNIISTTTNSEEKKLQKESLGNLQMLKFSFIVLFLLIFQLKQRNSV